MFVKGLLFGIVVGFISVYAMFWFFGLGRQVVPGSVTSMDIRGIGQTAVSFFGGMGSGVGLVLTVIFGGIYAFYVYALHHIPPTPR